MVGNLSNESEVEYGKILLKYFMNPKNLFVFSTDFCHWGKRFEYTF